MFKLCEHVHRLVFCLLNFGLLWQRSQCDKGHIYQLFPYFLFLYACPKLNLILISRLTGKRPHKVKKTYAIAVYGHVDIFNINTSRSLNKKDDFGLIVSL